MNDPIKKRVTMMEKEIAANGVSKATGRPYTIFNYLADDGEHYRMFDDIEPGKPVDLIGTEKEWQGKTVIEWKQVKMGGSPALAGLTRKLDEMNAKLDLILKGLPR